MLVFHILSFGFVVGVTALADKEAFAWLRGKKQMLEPEALHSYHLLVWAGLLALIGSGLFLFYPMWEYLLGQPLFIIKLLFVAVLVVNGILIGRLQHVATIRPAAELPFKEKLPLFASGAVSFISWSFAAAIAFYLFQ